MNNGKKILGLIVIFFMTVKPVFAFTITDLLDAALKHPGAEITRLGVKESRLSYQSSTDELYPKISLFGRAEWYNSPTNLRPMPPTEVNVPAGESIPFSEEILRYGIEMKMPLYSKKLYALRNKLNLLSKNSDIVNRINLSTRQAKVVSMNSLFIYLSEMEKAVSARIKSLEKTENDVKLKVKNGRVPETEWVKINNSVIELSQQRIDLTTKLIELKKNMKKLTGLDVNSPVEMKIEGVIQGEGKFIEVEKERILLKAAKEELVLKRAEYFPVVSLYGKISGNDGNAYNTDDHIYRNYNTIGLVVEIPLFDKPSYTKSDIAKIQIKKAEKKLEELKIQLLAESEKLRETLPMIENSIQLAEKSVKNNEELLKVAKVSFNSGRETTEEYLRYENQLLAANASLQKYMDEKWQIFAQQAILNGIDLKGVVK